MRKEKAKILKEKYAGSFDGKKREVKMKIEKGKTYRIKSDSPYFVDKYGTSGPSIIIEGTDHEVFGGGWEDQSGNPTCVSYAVRLLSSGVRLAGQVYYGKIDGLGELVHESELEEA